MNSIPLPPALEIATLRGLPGVCHGFFGREGGRSQGIYASNNCGLTAGDDNDAVAANRAACAARLGLENLITVTQRHTPTVEVVTAPWADDGSPIADAMVTATPGIGLAIQTADCAPVLFADAAAGVVGGAHAGWRGAFDGVLAATVAAMTALGAKRGNIVAAIGPCIGQASYEVGPEFVARFIARDQSYARYFANPQASGHHHFDLAGFVAATVKAAGVDAVTIAGRDTCAEDATYFSYRRNTLQGVTAYGRQISVIGRV